MSGSFLDQLLEEDRGALLARGRVRPYARGEALFLEQDPPDRVHILLSGRVKLVSVTEGGREALLAVRGEGQLLGELSALDGEARSATAIAVEPVQALILPAGAFVAFLAESRTAMETVLCMLASRLRDADRKRIEFTAGDALGRVAARLLELGDEHGQVGPDGLEVALPLSQEELAGWVGTSREAVAKALSQMRALGWLSTGRRSVVLHDVDALRRRAA